MARATLKQEIQLDGARDVQRALKELGEAGERALKEIREATEKARTPTQRLAGSVDDLRDQFGRLGGAGQNLGRSLSTVGKRLALVGAGVAGVAAAFFAVARAGAAAADEAGKQAQSAGVSIETYTGLQFALEQAGVQAGDFENAMRRLNQAVGEAVEAGSKGARALDAGVKKGVGGATETFNEFGVVVRRGAEGIRDAQQAAGVTVRRGIEEVKRSTAETGAAVRRTAESTSAAAAVFTKLGVTIRDANGTLRANDEILGDLADAFSRMPDGAEKSALAIQLFGRTGQRMIPFLNAGREGMQELLAEAQRLGLGFTQEQFRMSEAMNDSLNLLGRVIQGVRNQLGILFAPAITSASDALIELVDANRAAMLDLGSKIAAKVTPIVQDFIAVLQGRDADVDNIWILEWRDAIVQFGSDVRAVVEGIIIPAWLLLRRIAQTVADALNSIFGSEITAGQVLIAAAIFKLLGVFRLLRDAVVFLREGFRLLRRSFRVIADAVLVAFAAFSKLTKGTAIRSFFSVLVRGATVFLGLIAGLVGWPALIVAGVIAAGAAVALFWDEIKALAETAYLAITRGAEIAWAFLESGWPRVAEAAEAVWRGLVQAADAAWEGVRSGAQGALDFLTALFSGDREALAEVWAGIQRGADALWRALQQGAAGAWEAIIAGAGGLALRLEPNWQAIKQGAAGAWDFIASTASALWDRVVSVFTFARERVAAAVGAVANAALQAWTGATEGVVAAAQAITEAIRQASDIAGNVEGAEALAQALVQPFKDAQAQIEAIWEAIEGFVENGFDRLSDLIDDVADDINSAISRILSALRRAVAEAEKLRAQATAASSSSSGGGGAGVFAGGGAVHGPGTSTSDSIPAWLSTGEFVVRAKAVDRYGPALFAALNGMRIPPEVLEQLRGFAGGGAVGFRVPAFKDGLPGFALGALVQRLVHPLSQLFSGAFDGGNLFRNFERTLSDLRIGRRILPDQVGSRAVQPQFPGKSFDLRIGTETFAGLLAPEHTADRLFRFATVKQHRSLGRAPSWVGS